MIEMSGFICGYISCVFYLGSRFPQLYKNVSRFLAKYTCVFYKMLSVALDVGFSLTVSPLELKSLLCFCECLIW